MVKLKRLNSEVWVNGLQVAYVAKGGPNGTTHIQFTTELVKLEVQGDPSLIANLIDEDIKASMGLTN